MENVGPCSLSLLCGFQEIADLILKMRTSHNLPSGGVSMLDSDLSKSGFVQSQIQFRGN